MSRKLEDWKNSYIKHVDNTEPPDLYKEWVAISVIASALERKVYLKFGSLEFFPNMYVVLVGPSGRCRKSIAMRNGRELLDYIDIKKSPNATSRVGLIDSMIKAVTNQYATTDGTVVPAHCSLTVYSPELTVFLGYGQSELLTDLTDWYDCDANWIYKTIGRGEEGIKNVWVNMLGATTPDLISSALPRDTVGGGLASRIIFVYETKKGKSVPLTRMQKQDKALVADLQHDLQEINLIQGEFTTTPEFAIAFELWYNEIDANRPTNDTRFSGYIERRATHLIKLCVILSASRSNDRIVDEKIFARALDLLIRTEVKMFQTFRGSGSADTAKVTSDIMDVITSRGVITYKELLYMFYHDVLKYNMDKILETLVEMGFCTTAHVEGVVVYKVIK